MKKKLSIFFTCCVPAFVTVAQPTFIEKANIEFEVKTNLKKKMGSGMWGEMIQNALPAFEIAYYNFTFAGNKSIYKLNHFDKKIKIPDWMRGDEEESEWYTDHNTGTLQMKRTVAGTPFFLKDSIAPIEWKLVNENITIAGFNCRKAIGKIFDSVYVFVFYTDEIPISGGPCNISGLPGMILGMTIPRLYTSWIATKIMVNGINENTIKPVEAKKPMKRDEFRKFMLDRTKDWGGGDEEGRHFKEQFLWEHML